MSNEDSLRFIEDFALLVAETFHDFASLCRQKLDDKKGASTAIQALRILKQNELKKSLAQKFQLMTHPTARKEVQKDSKDSLAQSSIDQTDYNKFFESPLEKEPKMIADKQAEIDRLPQKEQIDHLQVRQKPNKPGCVDFGEFEQVAMKKFIEEFVKQQQQTGSIMSEAQLQCLANIKWKRLPLEGKQKYAPNALQ